MKTMFFCIVAFAAGIAADEAYHIIAHHVRRRLRAWRKAHPGYRQHRAPRKEAGRR